MRLTLRTLLAYLDDALDPAQAKVIGQKLAESPSALELVDRIRKVTRRRGLSTPPTSTEQGSPSDPNTVAAYLSDALSADQIAEFEATCLASDVHLAEVAACHQILTLVISEQVLVPPTAVRRMYGLVKGRESIPNRKPGNTIPVGGLPGDAGHAMDDSDAPYLLGMSAYSQSQPIVLRVLKWSAVAALVFGFAVASYMAWPSVRVPTGSTPQDVALIVPTIPVVKPTTEEPKPPPAIKPEEPKVEEPKPMPPVVVPPKPVEPVAEPAPPADPQVGRIVVAKLETQDDHVLVARDPDDGSWSRVASGGELVSSDRLVCLPGYRTKVKFDSGLTAELWGNLPELLGFPVLDTSVTLHIAPQGYDGELTLHVGRVYFNTAKAGGAKVRVRFLKEVWDITLPDSKTEVVLELSNELTPGQPPESPQSVVVLSTISGSSKLRARLKDYPAIPAKQIVLWTSKGPALDGPRASDPKLKEPDAAYFDRFAVLPNVAMAKPTRAALEKFAKLLQPRKSVSDKLTETQQIDIAKLTDEAVFGSRFALYAFAALGEFSRVIDALNDSERPFCRMTAIQALRAALATQPNLEASVHTLAQDKFRMTKKAADAWVGLLRGLTNAERTDPATIDSLVVGLSAPEIAERELNFFLLSQIVDPTAQFNKELMSFDAGGSTDRREAGVRLWKRRMDEIKAAIKAVPPK